MAELEEADRLVGGSIGVHDGRGAILR